MNEAATRKKKRSEERGVVGTYSLALGYWRRASVANQAPRFRCHHFDVRRAMSTDFSGKRVTVMGLGSFGGGIGAVKFLAAQGALVTVTDLKTAAELAPALD